MAVISFEGATLGRTMPLEEEVGLLLSGRRLPPTGRDPFVHRWLGRAWASQSADGKTALASAVGSHLVSPDVRARSEAVRFFQTQRHVDDRGALQQALESHPELFGGIEDPIPGAPSDLRMELARAIANSPKRVSAPGAVEMLRSEALREGSGGGVIAGLFFGDRDWVMEHAEEIVEAAPSSYTTILLNLALSTVDASAFVSRMRSVVPDEAAAAIVRERFATRADLLKACLEALDASVVH